MSRGGGEYVYDNDYCDGHNYDDNCDGDTDDNYDDHADNFDDDDYNDHGDDYNDDADNSDNLERSPPAPVEPWRRGTRRPAGKQTGPAAAAAKIQNFGCFHLLKVFYICQTFDILHFLIFCNNDNNGSKT